MSDRRLIGRVLVRSVAEHDWAAPAPGMEELVAGRDLSGLPAAAAFHGVAGCVHASLRGVPAVPAGVHEGVAGVYHHGLRTHLRALGDLRQVAPALDALDVPWLVVKGPALATTAYARPDLRSYGDVDVLVPAGALPAVLDALQALGCRLVDRNWVLLRERRPGEVHLVLPYGTVLDLHWHVLNEPSLRQVFTVPVGAMVERARPLRLGQVVARTLDPVDTLLHLGLHACLSGGNRLIWVKDVERWLARHPPDWDEVVGRAREWGAGLAVAESLRQARDVLGADVPGDALAAMTGSRVWPAVTAAARRLAPVERATGRRTVARMAARSVRRDGASSLAELGRHLARALFRSNPFDPEPATDDTDPASPGSILHPAGDQRDLEAFLEAARLEAAGPAAGGPPAGRETRRGPRPEPGASSARRDQEG